jgi:hypothetical protein
MRPSFPLLKPPLEVLETFGGAKVSDDDQPKTELEIQKTQPSKVDFEDCSHNETRSFLNETPASH